MEYSKKTTHFLELDDKDMVELGDLIRVIQKSKHELAQAGEQQVVDFVNRVERALPLTRHNVPGCW